MQPRISPSSHKPRELRRRVLLPARLRGECGWSEACILNISSRGMLIHSSRAAVQGSMVELWHGDRVIVARVMWRKGTKAGLRAQERVPVEDIVTGAQMPSLQLIAGQGRVEPRRKRRISEDGRLRSRAFDFASVVVIAVALGASVFTMVEQALAEPLAYVEAALGG